MKIIGYLYNDMYMDYDVYVSNGVTYTSFKLDKPELDAILKINDGSVVEFRDHRQAMTECVLTLSTTELS
jgi:hypothetical protein